MVGIVSGHGNFKKGLIAWILCLSGYCSNFICGKFQDQDWCRFFRQISELYLILDYSTFIHCHF